MRERKRERVSERERVREREGGRGRGREGEREREKRGGSERGGRFQVFKTVCSNVVLQLAGDGECV